LAHCSVAARKVRHLAGPEEDLTLWLLVTQKARRLAAARAYRPQKGLASDSLSSLMVRTMRCVVLSLPMIQIAHQYANAEPQMLAVYPCSALIQKAIPYPSNRDSLTSQDDYQSESAVQ
jgi:hypothetical protein